jgi:hypothetical protein
MKKECAEIISNRPRQQDFVNHGLIAAAMLLRFALSPLQDYRVQPNGCGNELFIVWFRWTASRRSHLPGFPLNRSPRRSHVPGGNAACPFKREIF